MRLLPVLLFLITSVAECLMLSRVLVPQYKIFGEDALLKCEYDLGRDRLYAVKWYKDNEEFFRYVPRFNPPIYTHPVEGVRVETVKSNDKRVLLRSVTVRSTGVYRCEVSAEAPSFASIMGEGRLTVVYLPKEAPQITGNVRDEYEVGDVLDLNCTSSKSFPPAKLSWYINDSPVDVPWSIALHPAPLDEHNTVISSSGQQQIRHGASYHGGSTSSGTGNNNILMVSSLRLQLQLQAHHFGPHGTAKVRCVARISPLFWQDGDEKIFVGHHSRHQHDHRKKELELEGGGEGNVDPSSSSVFPDDEEEDYPEVENSHHHHHSSSHHQSSNSRGHLNNNNGDHHNHKTIHHHHHQHNHNRNSHPDMYDEEDDEDNYGLALPAFQREALVLVRGGCSSRFITFAIFQWQTWMILVAIHSVFHPLCNVLLW